MPVYRRIVGTGIGIWISWALSVIAALYPANDLYPRDDLYPAG